MTVPSITCSKCRKELPEKAKVCGYCGHRLDSAVTGSHSIPTSIKAGPIAGAALLMSSAMVPWFLPTIGRSPWGVSIPRLFGLRVHSALNPDLGSLGTLLLVLGALGLALSIRPKVETWRRLLGLIVIALVAGIVSWELNQGAATPLQILGIGPVVATAGGLLLLIGGRAVS